MVTEDPQDLYTYLRHGKNGRSLILNRKEDPETYSDYPYSIVYKLYDPLPDEIEEGDMVYVTKELSNPYEETVQLLDFVDEDITDVVLRNPKLDSNEDFDGYFRQRTTQYKNKNELLTTNTTISNLLENKILSGSFLDSIELDGIDFGQFENFVKFSSVEDRVVNFRYKLQLIELYESQSLSFRGVNGAETEYTHRYDEKSTKLKNDFTPFEKYMYYETSSYVSSSLGVFHNNWKRRKVVQVHK